MGGAEDYAGGAPVIADVQGELAEALRNHRDGATVTGDREQDYRPGAPCMDCGDYPGPRHEASDCPRSVARALLPTVQALIAEEGKRAAAAALRKAAESAPVVRFDNGYPVRAVPVSDLLSFAAVLDRAAALDPAGADSGEASGA